MTATLRDPAATTHAGTAVHHGLPDSAPSDAPEATSEQAHRIDRRLGRALLRRELGVGLLAGSVGLAAAGFALGRMLVVRDIPLLSAEAGVPVQVIASGDTFALWIASHALPLPFVFAAGLTALGRVSNDRGAPWLTTLVAAGASRRRYVATAVGVVVLAQCTLLIATLAGVFTGIWANSGGAGSLLQHALHDLPGMLALTLSSALYGAACAALLRRRDAANWMAVLGIVIPLGIATWLVARTHGSIAPGSLNPLTLLMPPPSWASEPGVLLRHALYVGMVGTLLLGTANRWVARDR